MEQPKPDTPAIGKPRSRILSRLAIWIAIILVSFGGLVIWDRHDYPIPYASDKWGFTQVGVFDYEPPDFFESLQIKLGEIQGWFRSTRAQRIQRKLLKNLVITETSWRAHGEGKMSKIFENVIIHFLPDGSLIFNYNGHPIPEFEIFEFDRYTRTSDDTLICSNGTVSKTFRIHIRQSDSQLSLRLEDTYESIRLEPFILWNQ